MSTLRMKSILAVLVAAAIAGVVPQAHATTANPVVIIAGSSAMWQTMALGAYNSGGSIITGGGITCHWTSGSNAVNLLDTRSVPTANVDPGTVWVVWDNNASASTCLGDGTNSTTNVWAYIKVDSVVGLRCWFAAPKCQINGSSSNINVAGSNQIKLNGTIWGGSTADFIMPSYVQSLFTGSTLISVAASDIRPEDGAFAACRVNSSLGASAGSGGAPPSDSTDGLGYNSNNAAGVCPVFNASTAQAKGIGSPILSAVSIINGGTSTSQANVLAFNISGHDPITNSNVSASTVTNVGATPIIFVISRQHALTSLTTATENQLQQVFSGTTCDASALGLPLGSINAILREPLSGTMNTTESNVFRRPTVYPSNVLGLSQETNVNPGSGDNPLNKACGSGGTRFRAIGTGEEVKSVLKSPTTAAYNNLDAIGYTFFSYGNISSIIGNTYGYIQLNGVDPVWQSYGAGNSIDAGQSTNAGNVPNAADLPVGCAGGLGSLPCAENVIWGNGFSFPNVRNGTYRAWSLLRLVATGTASTNAKNLVTASNKFVVTAVPDYIPAGAVTTGGVADLGLKLLRSHYQQKDGSSPPVNIGKAPVNSGGTEAGGDMGGMIIPTTIGVTTMGKTQIVQSSDSNGGLGPVVRH